MDRITIGTRFKVTQDGKDYINMVTDIYYDIDYAQTFFVIDIISMEGIKTKSISQHNISKIINAIKLH